MTQHEKTKEEFQALAEKMRREYDAMFKVLDRFRARAKVLAICPDLSDEEADEIGFIL